MSIEPISPIVSETASAISSPARANQVPGDFSAWLSAQIENVNQQIVAADGAVQKLAVGEATNLHQVMTELEKAKLSFEMVVTVRNKLLEAYQDVMRMQI
jgi:flagellar hook-basal body complex protein FliE